ncbi:IPT/TIG domain-containing protein [Bdellovibrio bacteriovorus]|uniref:IPT/TIG domain-containing protein n=1 Tax=Bdellovibrio TaxID=958 RepID=UPI0035A8E6C4
MFKYVLTLILILVAQASFAAKAKFYSTRASAFNSFIQALNESPQFSLASIRLSPLDPKQGDKITAFVELKTEYAGNGQIRPIVSGKLDGKDVTLLSRGPGLWILQPTLVQTLGEHKLDLQLWLEDQAAAQEIRKAMTALNQELVRLSSDLNRERDSKKKTEIQRLIDEKSRQKFDLENTLSALKRPVGTKTERFYVMEADSSSAVYPKITAVQPQSGDINGGTGVTIHGQNLDNVISLKIGTTTIPLSQLNISSSKIEFITPALAAGLNSIEVTKTINGEDVISKLENAFFALDGNQNSQQAYPTAFAGLPTNGKVGEPIQLDGSQSYDPAGSNLSYSWSIVSRPALASGGDGTFSGNDVVNPTFVALTEGTWVLALTVNNGSKSSVPSLTTVTVGSLAPITIIPSSVDITGPVSLPAGGTLTICNNKSSKISLQLVSGVGFYLGLGFTEILPLACIHTSWNGQIGTEIKSGNAKVVILEKPLTSIDLPFVFRPQESIVRLYADSANSNEIISFLQLAPTYDETSVTNVFVKNTSNRTVSLTSEPLVTLIGASTNFPQEGISLLPGQVFELQIMTPLENFPVNGEGKLIWKTTDEGLPLIVNLSGQRLSAPQNTSITFNFNDTPLGQNSSLGMIDFCNRFIGYCPGVFRLTEVELVQIGGPSQGVFSFNKSWNSLPFDFGNGWEPNALWIEPIFTPSQAGAYGGTIMLKVRGYSQPFTISFTGNATEVN